MSDNEVIVVPDESSDENPGGSEVDLQSSPTECKAQKSSTGIVYDDRMGLHFNPRKEHMECPDRIESIYKRLVEDGLFERCALIPARSATNEELTCVHDAAHVQMMEELAGKSDEELAELEKNYNSIYFNRDSMISARLSAGSFLGLVSEVITGNLKNGAAVIRPPGHHAETHEAMGFCIFNNVAIAAKWATTRLGLERVLIVDWDVHHGNGTQKSFYDDPSVLYFSAHRFDNGSFFPPSSNGHPSKIGVSRGAGFNLNVAWNGTGYGDGDYLAVWNQLLLPVAYEFAPQLVLISAGFDAARGDPLGQCDLTPPGYAHLTQQLMGLANGKVVVALEGGYNLESISRSMAACVGSLLGDPPPPLISLSYSPSAFISIRETIRAALPYWKSLGIHRLTLQSELERWWCGFCCTDNLSTAFECLMCDCPKPEDGPTYYPTYYSSPEKSASEGFELSSDTSFLPLATTRGLKRSRSSERKSIISADQP